MVMLVSEYKGNVDELLDNKEWIAELKRDGIRVQIIYKNNNLTILNRKGEVLTKDFPQEIKDNLLENLKLDNYAKSFIIDGELTYTTDKGIDHRTQAQNPAAGKP